MTAGSLPLPDPYHVLLDRSIFARDGVPAPNSDGRNGRNGRKGPGDRDPGEMRAGTEGTLVFRGATLREGRPTAYVENTSDGHVYRFNPGDPIAAGRVADVTLNTLDYEASDKTTRLLLGQNLLGAVVAPPAPAAPQGPTTIPTGVRPGGAGGPGSPGGPAANSPHRPGRGAPPPDSAGAAGEAPGKASPE